MPPFPKPKFAYDFDVDEQIAALRAHESRAPGRAIPRKADDRLLVATWNIANLGLQERRPDDYRLLGEIVSWFDLIAVQEVNDNLTGIRGLHDALPDRYALSFSDASGNNERQAFFHDTRKVRLGEKVGRVAIPPSELDDIDFPGVTDRFDGFDRGPYVAAFHAGDFVVLLVNVHLFFGSDKPADKARRAQETLAVARWADHRRRSKNAYTKDIVALGDFNLPKAQPGDPIHDALTSRGLELPAHSTQIASSISTDNHYDQVAFVSSETSEFTGRVGVFDYDTAIFRDLFEDRGLKDLQAYCRYYMSDHRPMWAEFRTKASG